MYLLTSLQNAALAVGERTGGVTVEHRLACSGELYNARILTAGGWRKSDATRVLCLSPFELFVVSRPFNAYPQELCLRLTLDYVVEECAEEKISARRMFLPNDEVVEDLCSILSLLARRLIVPAGLVREQQHSDESSPALGSFGSDLPHPILNNNNYTAWIGPGS
jgi:hypothetical protein